MDSSGKHGRGRGIGRVLQKGGQGAGEAKRKRRQSVCSATVRHAGMCPAAAAGSEDDDRTYVVVIALFLLLHALNEIHCPRVSYPSIMYS